MTSSRNPFGHVQHIIVKFVSGIRTVGEPTLHRFHAASSVVHLDEPDQFVKSVPEVLQAGVTCSRLSIIPVMIPIQSLNRFPQCTGSIEPCCFLLGQPAPGQRKKYQGDNKNRK